MPRVILRTLKCLGIGNDTFQSEMIAMGVIKRATPYLKAEDDECRYWALVRGRVVP